MEGQLCLGNPEGDGLCLTRSQGDTCKAFQLPNREKLNDIGGAAFGAVNGVCFGILLCWALQFAGPVIGCDTLAHTALAKALQAIDVLTLGASV